MQHLSLTGRVSPAGAFLRATHLFKCAGEASKPIEAIYIFMLPRNASLRRFIIKGEGFEVESKLSPREEARKEYEAGVQAGHLSSLAEMNTDGMISLSVGQVQPEETITVIVELVAGVDVQDGKYRFRFPFTLAPNYHAQAKMTETSTGGKIEIPSSVFGDLVLPEWRSDSSGLHQVSFKIHVEAGGTLDSVASPSHRILVRPGTNGSAEVELSAIGDTPNRDLVLDVVSKEISHLLMVDQKILNQTTEPDDPKTPEKAPRWTIVIPSSAVPKATDAPREVCFVMDSSGSMEGEPIQRAKVALKACLSALNPTDKFGLIHFNFHAHVFHKEMIFATDV
ncbi:MAG: VIT and VWA domain-containing protein, partial [Bacteroidota bacterium]